MDSTGRRQKNKRGDSKVELNDSPEIPERGETADFPSLLSGNLMRRTFLVSYLRSNPL